MYTTEIGSDKALAICGVAFTLSYTLISAVLPDLVNTIGPSPLFYIYGAVTLTAAVFMYFFVKETAHLTDKEKKMIYAPKS